VSLPVSECLFYRACNDDVAYTLLLERMRINMAHGAFTLTSCTHQPPCVRPGDFEMETLDTRLRNDLRKKPRS